MSGGGTFPLKILDEPMAMETRRLDGAFEKRAIMEVRSSRMKSGSQKNFVRPLKAGSQGGALLIADAHERSRWRDYNSTQQ